ncbi:MAG: hypothetical protein IOC54_03880 [Methylobacterium sp.]|nr:hypothetical protein [Methylobacterium sp.]MCA3646684.1 hypothetical protein [Methylobacterium sp.]MCA3650961.1 hypothetical protein [Methylobacterium sp.]MCA4922600.1 hypothetical protein [Methylobacterium sp.]
MFDRIFFGQPVSTGSENALAITIGAGAGRDPAGQAIGKAIEQGADRARILLVLMDGEPAFEIDRRAIREDRHEIGLGARRRRERAAPQHGDERAQQGPLRQPDHQFSYI